jgi:hypothetical protein
MNKNTLCQASLWDNQIGRYYVGCDACVISVEPDTSGCIAFHRIIASSSNAIFCDFTARLGTLSNGSITFQALIWSLIGSNVVVFRCSHNGSYIRCMHAIFASFAFALSVRSFSAFFCSAIFSVRAWFISLRRSFSRCWASISRAPFLRAASSASVRWFSRHCSVSGCYLCGGPFIL